MEFNKMVGLKLIAPPQFWIRDYTVMANPILEKVGNPLDQIMKVEQKVAIINIRGLMTKGAMWYDEANTALITEAVQTAATSKRVQAILLNLDTPGGSVDGLDRLADAVYGARQVKPVAAQVDGMAASAGYYVASQANKIFTGRGDMLGSIGTLMVIDDYSEMFKNEGVKTHLIATGDYKGAGTPGVPVTEKQLKDFQRIVDAYYGQFLDAIKRGRSMDDKKLKDLADGRLFVGQEAVDNGLADGVQGIGETFIQLAAQAQIAHDGAMALQDQDAARLRLASAS